MVRVVEESWVEIDTLCIAETQAALLIEHDGERVWVPRSVIADDSEVTGKHDEGVLVIAEWFANKQGLI